jgi:hypothetical protein
MMDLLSGAGLRSNEKAGASGAQTERRSEAWAGEELAWRQNLTGRFCCQVVNSSACNARNEPESFHRK